MFRWIALLMLLVLSGFSSFAAAAPDTFWPVAFDSPAGRIEVYQPQPDSLKGDKLSARAAVSLLAPGANEPIFGAMWFQARIATDRDDRTTSIQDVAVGDVRLPEATGARQQQFTQALKEQLPKMTIQFSLDQLMTSLDVAEKENAAAEQLRTDPPKVLFSTVPATLVTIDGPPKLQQVDQSPLMHVANTPFLILFDPQAKRYFLKAGVAWATALDVAGPWETAPEVPPIVMDVAARFQQPSQAHQAQTAAAAVVPDFGELSRAAAQPIAPPRIIVATEPSELIVTDGESTYTPLPGNDLLYVSNTQSNLFRDIASQDNYVLLSGRWYRSKSLEGPWQYVAADRLPAAFANIPADSPKANVRAFVAGTQEAREAVLDASVPQTAAVRRDAGASLQVTYDGAPQYAPIQGTAMSYAINSAEAVISVNGTYYCCSEAVWYQAASPTGPWTVCVSVPPEIYTIPPSSPVYNVRYVSVYDYDADHAYVGYLPGYAGCYVYGPTVVYGTGYDYPGWYGSVYYPGPFTWGYGACFDNFNDSWDFGLGFTWGPEWFWHDHFHHHWFGPGGFRDFRHFEDHRFANMHGRDFDDHHNVYRRFENEHPNMIVHREGSFTRLPSREENNVFAGHDGQVYRRSETGWDARVNHGWTPLNRVPEARAPAPAPALRAPEFRAPEFRAPQPAPSGMEADRFARERGASRAGGFNGGGFRGGGFAGHGGGGGRR